MKARYENDPVRGPGYGLLYVEDAAVPGTDVRFAIIRSGDHKTLHPESWEDTECRLIPDGVSARDNGLCLAVGPGVVRQLDELNTYRFVLFPSGSPNAPLQALLELSGIVYPPEDAMSRVGVAPAAKAAPAPPPAPEPGSETEPDPEPAPEALPPLPPGPAKTPYPLWLIALLLLLLAGGGVGAWFMLKDKPADPATAEAVAEPDPAGPATEKPEADPPASEARAEESPPSLSPMEQARQFLRGNGSAADGLALSRALPRTPAGRDAAYLLLAAAAEQGQPEAMFGLAAFYDPLDADPKGSILPDAEQAWMWYGKAEQAGHAGAADRKRALRTRLEEEAGKGSSEAGAILSRIQ